MNKNIDIEKHAQLVSILLIEDEMADAVLVQRSFKKIGRNNVLHHITDGQQALDYLFGEGAYNDRKQYPLPSLILLDLKLPKIKGLDVLRRIKKQELLKRIPVVVFSASDQPADINSAYDLGANGYLVKPVSYSALVNIIENIGNFWLQENKFPSFVE